MGEHVLGEIGVRALVGRGLNPETAVRLGFYTGRSVGDGEVVPDANGNIIVFPSIEHGVVVNEKYRAPGKRFWQKPGGKKTFINSDVLDDPLLQLTEREGGVPLVITEGELDMHTAIDVGFPHTVSVPDGAPPATEASRPLEPITPETESGGKFEFMWNNMERLKKIRRFIIAVDNDPPGQRLAQELVRRLSASCCYSVSYPVGCKDLNDVLTNHGADAAKAVIDGAKPYPIKGLYTLADYPESGQIETFSTGWGNMDHLFKVFFPSLIVVTGIPSHGKSTFITNFLVHQATRHGFKSAMFSPEMPVVPHLRDKIRRMAGASPLERLTAEQIGNLDDWINHNFVFIDYDINGEDDEDITIEWLMKKAYEAIIRHGIRFLVIDPWNEVEHAKDRHESITEYINRAVRQLRRFAIRHGICVILIAHPTKDVAKEGKQRVPTLYDIDGSAAWFNKPDIGIIVDRPDANVDETDVYVAKVRFEGTGEKGFQRLAFDRETSRFLRKA
jgi:twinkle protein